MIFKSKKKASKNGFTLMEVMVSVSILVMGIVGSFGLISSSMSKFSSATNKIIASNLAQDGLERVRNQRDTNWLRDKTTNSNGSTGWDDGISGDSSEEYIKFSCASDVKDKIKGSLKGSINEEGLIDDCISKNNPDNNCQVYKYYNGSTWENSTSRCISDDVGDVTGYRREAYENFYRLIHIKENGPATNTILVTVKWTDRMGSHVYTAQEDLHNWKEK